ncbi:CBS domain-containing protein [Ostreibacterium oceani]|uniref:CBS domain-containing protein n=1 Tax=Ostreibacterium oceani TaxID=2654998 RepID=A0A6N7EX04_9GAMM|nr:CBS domain-containing protein [Ostreibacterium oceani]MPV85949.1 CBS domain-containing protein [Ostreibacterium oceani]
MSLLCKDVMLTDQPVLKATDTMRLAYPLIRQKGVRFLPVIDDDGKYLGVFTSSTLVRLLLPTALTIHPNRKDADTGIGHLHFFHMKENDFHERLEAIQDEKVVDYLSEASNIPTAKPETPILEGVLLLYKYKRHVVIVDENTHQYKGLLTIHSVLDNIFGPYDLPNDLKE